MHVFKKYTIFQSSYYFKPRVKQRNEAKHLPAVAEITKAVKFISKVYIFNVKYTTQHVM